MARMIATDEPTLVSIEERPLDVGARFRDNVERILDANKISHAELARRLTEMGDKTDADAIRKLLKSTSFPSTRWLELFSRALNVTEADLLIDRRKKSGRA